jgi:hypothetical protein
MNSAGPILAHGHDLPRPAACGACQATTSSGPGCRGLAPGRKQPTRHSPRRGRSRWRGPRGLAGDCGVAQHVARVWAEDEECARQCEHSRGSLGKHPDVQGVEGGGTMASPIAGGAPAVEGASVKALQLGDGWEGVRCRSIWWSIARGEQLTMMGRWWPLR